MKSNRSIEIGGERRGERGKMMRWEGSGEQDEEGGSKRRGRIEA